MMVALFALALQVQPVTAPAPGVELPALFPQQADVFVDGAGTGLARLPLPLQVLSGCKSDLADLRLLDAAGTEVAFLVDAGFAPDAPFVVTRSLVARHLGERRATVEQGRRGELRRESVEVVAPPAAAQGGWELVFEPAAADFVRQVRIREGGAAGGRVLLESSVFRHARRGQERLRLPLPPLDAASLVVDLEGEAAFFLEPVLKFESRESREELPLLDVPLAALSTRREGGLTVVHVTRPAGLVPDQLGVSTSTQFLEREVSVFDEGPGREPALLARALVRRVPGQVPVEQLSIPLRPAGGATLRIEVRDGDSPGLEGLAFSAIVRQPVLVFSVAGAESGAEARPAATLLFGGGRAHRPRYDVSALRPHFSGPESDTGTLAQRRAFDPTEARLARLGAIVANPRFDAQPALGFLLHPGAELDARAWSHRRVFTAPASRDGLVRVPLAPEDLAVLRADLADVRVVGGASRQWAYLVDEDAERRDLVVTEEPCHERAGMTCHVLELPASPLSLAALALDADAPFFDRRFELRGRDEDGGDVVLASGRLTRAAGDRAPVEVAVRPTRIDRLRLLIQDGDDAPLRFTRIVARVDVPHLLVAAPAGEGAVLLGLPDADAPRYEIERVRDVVLGVQAVDAPTGPLERNPDYSARARLGRGDGPSRLLAWAGIALAVIVLGGLTLRLARREGAAS